MSSSTVKEALDDYRFAIVRLSPRTQSDYLAKLTVFAEWCEKEGIGLSQVKQSVIRRFVESVRGHTNQHTGLPISSITVKGYTVVLKTFLTWLSKEDDYEDTVSSKVAARIELPRVEQKIIEVFTTDQLKALFAACEKEYNDELVIRNKAILSVLIDSGIRASELVGLTLENCFLAPDASYLKVFGKGSKWREVALGRQASINLRRYITRHRRAKKEVKEVFLSRFHQPMTVSGLDQLITRLGEWAKIKGVRCSPHTFRHTYAVNYLQASGDIYRLSRTMGHTSVRVTEVYLKAASSRMARSRVSVLDMIN